MCLSHSCGAQFSISQLQQNDYLSSIPLTARIAAFPLRITVMLYLLNSLIARFKAHLVYIRTREELTQLDDRALADLGFQRGEIEYIARKVADAA